jgi:hypothetical protein
MSCQASQDVTSHMIKFFQLFYSLYLVMLLPSGTQRGALIGRILTARTLCQPLAKVARRSGTSVVTTYFHRKYEFKHELRDFLNFLSSFRAKYLLSLCCKYRIKDFK